MLIAYVDESYDRDFYFVGAAVGDEFAWHEFGLLLSEVRLNTAKLHGLPEDIEFHAYEIMGGENQWASFRGRHREAAGVYAAVLGAAKKARIRFILRGLDLRKIEARRGFVNDPHGEALMHVLEQVNNYTIKRKQEDRTVVIADEIATHAEHQKQFSHYQANGTWGAQANNLERLESPIRFRSSKSEVGLQLADLAIYIHRRRHTVVEQHPLAQKTVSRLCKLIDPFTENWKMWPT